MSFINFESAKSIQNKREDIRQARNNILKTAEEKFYRKKAKEEEAKWRGEDKWMLPSLEKRLKEEDKSKGKKHKKHKKKKKKKSSTSSSSSGGSDGEAEWVEKHVEQSAAKVVPDRDEWMNMPVAVPTVGVQEARGGSSRKRNEDGRRAEQEKNLLDKPGQSDRELNPYWRDGGTGLPGAADGRSASRSGGSVGDRGADWLRRALQRVEEQAAEQGRTPREVAAERWGSLEKLESMLAAAERRDGSAGKVAGGRGERFKDRGEGGHRGRPGPRFQRPGEGAVASSRHPAAPSGWKKKSTVAGQEAVEPRGGARLIAEPSSSDSEQDGGPAPRQEASPELRQLSDKELNELGAKLVKAEIMGNESLAAELRQRLAQGRAARSKPEAQRERGEETVVLVRTDPRGLVRPLQPPAVQESSGGTRRKHKVDTHADGKRVRYFADDDEFTLQEMFEREKLTSVEDQNEMFSKMAAKGVGRTGSERDMDDMFEERARLKESEGRSQARERGRAIGEHRRSQRALDSCPLCLDGKLMLKHLLVSVGSKVHLSLPPHQSLTEGHCLLAPVHHVSCGTQLDEDVWVEVQAFRRALTAMFKKMDQDVVFFETAMHLRHFPHMSLQCVPMPREVGELAPIYFKKAILECEMEWASNKKLVDLAGRDVRRAVPKGLPYFAVDFGLQSGFAHVIEDEHMFPKNFAEEIIGGMLDLDHGLWRKQRRENFDAQRKKVIQFAKWWKPFDFTHGKHDSTSSESDTS